MSSSASSKRRKSGSRSQATKKDYATATLTNDGVNFFALVLGLTVGATLVLLIIGIFKKPSINAEILAGDEANIGKVAAVVKTNDFKALVENASTEELVKTLGGLNPVRPEKDLPKFVRVSRRRILVADQMMTRALNDEQRRLAATTKLQTLATMFWVNRAKNPLEVANLEVRLRDATNKFANDQDKVLSRIARLEKAALNSLTANRNVVDHSLELYELLRDFQNDEKASEVVFNCLSQQIANPETIWVAEDLARNILQQKPIQSADAAEKASAWSRITDLSELCERGFFDAFSKRALAGKSGLEELTAICTDLIELPTVGEEAVGQVEIAAAWFEQNDHYDLARKIYSSYLKNSPAIVDKRIAKIVRRNGTNGIKRCDAVGKPFSLAAATTLAGEKIDPASFEGQPVLIVYWSSEDSGIVRKLSEVEKASGRWRRGAVKVITVQYEKNKDQYPNPLARRLAKQHRTWDFCSINADGTHPLFDQIPSKKKWRLALLDRDHRLLDVEVEIGGLPTAVNSALAGRR